MGPRTSWIFVNGDPQIKSDELKTSDIQILTIDKKNSKMSPYPQGTWSTYLLLKYLVLKMYIMVSQVVENQTRVSKISILLACKSTYSEEICVYCTKRQRRDIKNRAFSEFKVNFQGLLSTKSSRKQFSLKNIKLEEQLLLKPFLVLVFYIKVYLVKMCLIFDGSSLAFGASYQSFLRVY